MLLACVCILKACIRILMPKNLDLGFLIFCLFFFVLIVCLSLVESIFHMFSSRVNRIICFTCFNVD